VFEAFALQLARSMYLLRLFERQLLLPFLSRFFRILAAQNKNGVRAQSVQDFSLFQPAHLILRRLPCCLLLLERTRARYMRLPKVSEPRALLQSLGEFHLCVIIVPVQRIALLVRNVKMSCQRFHLQSHLPRLRLYRFELGTEAALCGFGGLQHPINRS